MLKKLFGASVILCVPMLATPVLAQAFNQTIQDSVGISVQGAAVQTTRMGTTYSVAGDNVTVTGSLGLGANNPTAATSTTAAIPTPPTFGVTNAGQAFSLSETLAIGDTVINPSVPSNGTIDPVSYGNITTQAAGFAGTGTAIGDSPTAKIDTKLQTLLIVGGGVGTTVTAGRTVSLTAF